MRQDDGETALPVAWMNPEAALVTHIATDDRRSLGHLDRQPGARGWRIVPQPGRTLDLEVVVRDEEPCGHHHNGLRASPNIEPRSEEHTSELQSPHHLLCRLLLAKKKHADLLR